MRDLGFLRALHGPSGGNASAPSSSGTGEIGGNPSIRPSIVGTNTATGDLIFEPPLTPPGSTPRTGVSHDVVARNEGLDASVLPTGGTPQRGNVSASYYTVPVPTPSPDTTAPPAGSHAAADSGTAAMDTNTRAGLIADTVAPLAARVQAWGNSPIPPQQLPPDMPQPPERW